MPKAKIALEALREQATAANLAQRIRLHRNEIYASKKPAVRSGGTAFESGSSDGAADRERAIERLKVDAGPSPACADIAPKCRRYRAYRAPFDLDILVKAAAPNRR